jgi:hypothetical protein
MTGALSHNPIVQFLENRTSPVTQTFISAIKGNSFGKPFNINDLVTDPKALGKALISEILPLPLQAALDAPGNIGQKALAAGESMLGGHPQPISAFSDLASAWNQKYPNSSFTGESAQIKIANQDPTLAPLVQAWNQAGQNTSGGQQVQTNQAVAAQTEQNVNLPTLGQGVNQNVPGAGAQFTKAYSDYQQQMTGAFEMAYFGAPIKTPQSAEQTAYVAYRNVTPQQFQDPNTLVTDWNAYTAAKDAAKAALPNDLQTALANNLKMQDPAAQQAEARYQAAKTASQDYYNTPEYKNTTGAESDAVNNALKQMSYLATRTPGTTAADYLSSTIMQPLDQRARNLLVTLVTDSSVASYLRTPARNKILLANPDIVYFGMVSPSALNVQQKTKLPPYAYAPAGTMP